jgi:uncharacterized membrane protein
MTPMSAAADPGCEQGSSRSTARVAGESLESQQLNAAQRKRRPIVMPAFFALVLVAILAVVVLSIAVHILFSPWLLVAVAIVALIKFWPRHSRQ